MSAQNFNAGAQQHAQLLNQLAGAFQANQQQQQQQQQQQPQQQQLPGMGGFGVGMGMGMGLMGMPGMGIVGGMGVQQPQQQAQQQQPQQQQQQQQQFFWPGAGWPVFTALMGPQASGFTGAPQQQQQQQQQLPAPPQPEASTSASANGHTHNRHEYLDVGSVQGDERALVDALRAAHARGRSARRAFVKLDQVRSVRVRAVYAGGTDVVARARR